MRARHVGLGLLAVLLIGIVLFVAYAWRSALPPVDPPSPTTFDRALLVRGAQLAALGNCYECHTADGAPAYAGGRALKTPFGTLYGTNITPDPQTGIGRWSQAAFVRAMREGVDREGRHLYPAFPYDHFTLMPDDDLSALYAYLMSRNPVAAETPRNELPFPLNIRMLLAGWKLLFHENRRFEPDPAQSAEWNRGAYLVHGPSHCGACHTPRNFLGAEKKDEFLAGGAAQGWNGPALNAASPAPIPWTAEALYRYLATGADALHSVAAGPMAPVVGNLAAAPESDVRAIAAYVAAVAGPPSPERQRRAQEVLARVQRDQSLYASVQGVVHRSSSASAAGGSASGAAIYDGACGLCHDSGRQTPSSADALHLALSTSVHLSTPRNLVHIILDGIMPREGEHGPWMPAFGAVLTDDRQLVDLVVYLRERFGPGTAWENAREEIARLREERGREE